ncbi:MAG: FtsX-like permease family protein, partial [Thermoplasmata archaeon]|nr:ABC transporter permease [Thermoplasmata archaeon]NIS12822.1 ABC transporter permease [Thermoplasmata archaeon]NIS20727.1 ABC transporter permease [Thermoplasmata archaeon]NIT78131.1 ABC transporter permease [Thermoplasmata archaeon]NIU49798.1 ABC transporter permease [Thermoplasmata archaeon]
MVLRDGDVVSPPYDTSTDLAWGRHLSREDATNLSEPIPVVLGHYANEALNPNAGTLMFITLRPDRDVTPWWMPDANDYPLEARDAVTSSPRGPVEGRVVGVMSPDQGEDLDWGVFASVEPLMGLMGQHDESRGKTYYPQVVVTIDDGSRVDVRDLEETLVETVPGIQGTDDHWDPEEFKATYGGAVGALDGWLVIITVVLVIMLVAGVSDTTLVAVTDRRREIATLRAVGIGRRQVSRLVLTEVALLVGTGLLVGLVIGSSLALLFGYLHDATGGSGAFMAPTELSPLVLVGAATLA